MMFESKRQLHKCFFPPSSGFVGWFQTSESNTYQLIVYNDLNFFVLHNLFTVQTFIGGLMASSIVTACLIPWCCHKSSACVQCALSFSWAICNYSIAFLY